MDKTESIIRASFDAFIENDKPKMEKLLAPGFTFTSPWDDAIDRDGYFSRCWPHSDKFKEFRMEKIVFSGDGAFVTYLAVMKDGFSFRNTEYMTIVNGQIANTNVYFGASYRDGKFVKKE